MFDVMKITGGGKLSFWCDFYNLGSEKHRALSDADQTHQLFQILKRNKLSLPNLIIP
jgi:hypothetical protein